MATTYNKKRQKHTVILYTVITTILLFAVVSGMVIYLYSTAEEDAYENLHMQTKQIKDDISLQLLSDRENLATMANFAAKLYTDGEDYDIMFESFKPIGLIENIGILNPDNSFVTKAGSINLDGKISFDEEKERGAYISGRVKDLTRNDYEIIRTAVPIIVENETVGILYGVIKPEKMDARYNKMAKEMDAQLFVYDKETGDLVIDTVHQELGNISFMQDRKFNEGYSYEQMITTDKGFVAFESAYKDENLHLHYSYIEEMNWVIAFGRYDSQVFAATHQLARVLLFACIIMFGIIILYILTLMINERRFSAVTACASDVRKTLLETYEHEDHITEALKQVCLFAKARSAVFFDTDGEDYRYSLPENKEKLLSSEEKKYFMAELFRYGLDVHKATGSVVNVLCIKPDKHLKETDPEFYSFMKAHDIRDISFSATVNNANHTTILGTINAQKGGLTRLLADKISACFSMALYNKNYLVKTEQDATTDALTGTLNRVAYKNDLFLWDSEKTKDFSCVYVDVNELHLCNNKYGHAAGDEMLIYIANTLKEVFFGHKVYRMGGDEFVVFCENTSKKTVEKGIEIFVKNLEPKNYHVAIGMAYTRQNNDTEELLIEAEKKMYAAKAEYYQNKDEQNKALIAEEEFVRAETGIAEIDTMLSIMKENYNGIYRVSLDTDRAKRILMPAYLNYNEKEENYSKLFSKYVEEAVLPDYHRALLSFLNYDAVKRQLEEGKTPQVTYVKNDGQTVILSVYKLGETEEDASNTLWVFAKK